MEFDRFVARAAGVLAVLLLCGLAAAPARAQAPHEDTNPINSVLGFVGLQFDKESEAIDYRARAPLVVPPQLNLPAPKATAAARDPSWPKDPDIVARRLAARESQRPAPQVTPNTRVEMSQEELAEGRTKSLPQAGPADDCQASAGTPFCLYTPWKMLTNVIGGGSSAAVTEAGVEPDRRYLTEPPKGYRKATAAMAPKQEITGEAPDAADTRAYQRQQERKSSVGD
ncbi:hypothetical protein [Methylocella sp.]|uniref:hypothetical protein n=1 Tax=Methylocella sp. TaxID=1978226 RepID=UPI0037835404